MALIPEVQEAVALLAEAAGAALMAVTVACLLVRQLRWFGFDGLSRERPE